MTGHEVLERFRKLESELAEENGQFVLFALFLREEVSDRWDLIISAPWLGSDRSAAVEFLVKEIKSRLGTEDLVRLSRIIVADPQNPEIEALNRAIHIEHGDMEIRDSNFFGLAIKQALIITSKRPQTPAAA